MDGRPDRKREILGVVTNISEGGLQLESSEAMHPDRMVWITGATFECVGWTRYCNRRANGFLIGVELTRQPYLKDSCDFRD